MTTISLIMPIFQHLPAGPATNEGTNGAAFMVLLQNDYYNKFVDLIQN